ncbi:hypothetical protein K5M36_10760 [Chromobacterium vaccinii]|nr:hypothetical protein [Chromobacterium vaccinii]
MKDRVLSDVVKVENCPEMQDVFGFRFDWRVEADRRSKACQEWAELGSQEKKEFNNDIGQYLNGCGILRLNDAQYMVEKNTFWMREEIAERSRAKENLLYISVDELHHENSLMELMLNVENVDHIRELYKIRKANSKGGGLKADESAKLRNCIRQGTELFNAGQSGALMVKPLNFFYALTAYSYAVILLNSPLRFSLETLPGSHGVNYLPKDFHVQFGGGMARGTFTELFSAFPTSYVKNHVVFLQQSNFESIRELYENKVTMSTGTLLSMVPEIREYYYLATGRPSRAHPLSVNISHDSYDVKYKFQIGDGELLPAAGQVEQAFPGCEVFDRHGKKEVDVPVSAAGAVKAIIYTDSRGRFWFVENPIYPLIMPEFCLHFLISNIFSNVMRYSPGMWGDILLNNVDTDVSLIIRKYLSALEAKMPILSLRSISKYYPYVGA